jgi:hypothetical protein
MNYDEILGVRADWWADDMGGIAEKSNLQSIRL